MLNIVGHWFSGERVLPSGHAAQWMPELVWACLVSDAAIGIAFYAVSFALARYIRKLASHPIKHVTMLFALFIFACGTSHFVSLFGDEHADNWIDVGLNAVIALMALFSAVQIWKTTKMVGLHDGLTSREMIARLKHEIEERRKAEEALRESQGTLRELAAYQERIREDERKRISREIHDELGQNLLALRLDVASFHARLGERHPKLKERAAAALDHIDTTMKSIRTIMNNLRPSVLDLGLQAAIEWQVRQFELRHSVPCELIMSDDGCRIPDAQATAVFRILQESLSNVGRHARANHVRIELCIDDKQLTMTIQDNGVGMYPADRRKARRFGLIGIEERVTMLGGDLVIESTPGQGTVLRMTIPMTVERCGEDSDVFLTGTPA